MTDDAQTSPELAAMEAAVEAELGVTYHYELEAVAAVLALVDAVGCTKADDILWRLFRPPRLTARERHRERWEEPDPVEWEARCTVGLLQFTMGFDHAKRVVGSTLKAVRETSSK